MIIIIIIIIIIIRRRREPGLRAPRLNQPIRGGEGAAD